MRKADVLASFKITYPVLFSFIPLGMACGMVLHEVGFNAWMILLMNLLVYAGASQFMVAGMVALGASIPSMITMTFFLNLRHVLMSSSIAPYFKEEKWPFLMVFSHSLADESYALNYHAFTHDKNWSSKKAMITNWIPFFVWAISSWSGSLLGATLNLNTVILNYILVAMFIGLFVLQCIRPLYLVVGIFAGVLAVLLKILLKNNMAIVVAAILASFLGFFLDEYLEKRRKERGIWQ